MKFKSAIPIRPGSHAPRRGSLYKRIRRQWADPIVGPDLRALGFERPEQLGALFLAGADDLRALTADTPPLTDDRPKRLGRIPTRSYRLRPVYLPWMNVRRARERFTASEFVWLMPF